MRALPRRLFVAAQLVAAALVLYYVGRTLAAQWTSVRSQPLEARLGWWDIVASAAVVLLTYALLVHTWRVLLGGWGSSLSFWRAARIWSVSNLARYVPGKIWQIPLMAEMARREGISPVAATGSALLNTAVNIAAGIAIVLALGWRWLDQIQPEARLLAIGLVLLSAAGLALMPFLLPRLGTVASRLSGRDIAIAAPATRSLVVATLGNVVAWLLYGLAFMLLVRGVLGVAGAAWQYIAVFTASYVVGYLFLIIPGGIGPREAVMVVLLTSNNLATPPQALLVAGVSRVWLTILEIVPGLLFVGRDVTRRRSTPKPQADGSTD